MQDVERRQAHGPSVEDRLPGVTRTSGGMRHAVVGSDQEHMREALKRTAVALKDSGLRFALGGGYAAWARGAPEPDHDVDFVVAYDDADAAAEALRQAGLRVDQPPEDWLFKVFTDGAVVDIIHRTSGAPVSPEWLSRATDLEVLSVTMPVLSATDIVAAKLHALTEHQCDFSMLVAVARALREQVDWEDVRRDVQGNPYADAFLFLLQRLKIVTTATS
jgi:Uncharacterised nucleotidyltransferase